MKLRGSTNNVLGARPRGLAIALVRRPTTTARRIGCAAWIVPLLLLVSGCTEGIESGYGSRAPAHRRSVNGTTVLSELFEEAGHRVSSWRWLSPRLDEEADVIVWFPDDFEPPSAEVCEWLNTWLEAVPGRTLIYVGRDYDAAPTYWENVRPGASDELADEYARRLADARSTFRESRPMQSTPLECDWFTIDPARNRREGRFRDPCKLFLHRAVGTREFPLFSLGWRPR